METGCPNQLGESRIEWNRKKHLIKAKITNPFYWGRKEEEEGEGGWIKERRVWLRKQDTISIQHMYYSRLYSLHPISSFHPSLLPTANLRHFELILLSIRNNNRTHSTKLSDHSLYVRQRFPFCLNRLFHEIILELVFYTPPASQLSLLTVQFDILRKSFSFAYIFSLLAWLDNILLYNIRSRRTTVYGWKAIQFFLFKYFSQFMLRDLHSELGGCRFLPLFRRKVTFLCTYRRSFLLNTLSSLSKTTIATSFDQLLSQHRGQSIDIFAK